jgi:hypothetical protein
MTPKEKAKRIIKKHLKFAHITDDDYVFNGAENYYYNAKKCALITVNELLKEYWLHDTKRRDWWKEVKKEIELI